VRRPLIGRKPHKFGHLSVIFKHRLWGAGAKAVDWEKIPQFWPIISHIHSSECWCVSTERLGYNDSFSGTLSVIDPLILRYTLR
jgi:hypothetical protein